MSDGPLVIKESELTAHAHCPYSLHLDDIINEQRIPIFAFSAREAWLQTHIRKLFPDERFVGAQLEPIETLKGDALRRHLRFESPASLGAAVGGLWYQHVIKDQGAVHDRQVVWRYRNQWFAMKKELETAGTTFYQHLLDEGLPNLAYYHAPIDFEFEGIIFRTKFEEIRPGGQLGNHGMPERKMGSPAQREGAPRISQASLENDLKVTMRMLAFSLLSRSDFFQYHFGIGPTPGNSTMRPDITYTYHNLLTGDEFTTTRTDEDIAKLLAAARGVQANIDEERRSGDFSIRRQSCYICKYNVLDAGAPLCGRRESRYEPMKPMHLFPAEGT